MKFEEFDFYFYISIFNFAFLNFSTLYKLNSQKNVHLSKECFTILLTCQNFLTRNPAKFARSLEDFESTEILLRLSKIQRILQNTCSTIRLDKEFEKSNNNNNYDESTSDLKALISQMSVNIEKLPIKEIRQSFNLNRKHDKALEMLTATVNQIDERTVRIFDTNSYQFKKLLSNFKGTEEEVLTFTNNANILLKKVERTIRQGGVEKCHNRTQWNEVPDESGGDSTEVDDEIMDQKGEI